jgi:aminoglycoside phosphotransferase family enzyme
MTPSAPSGATLEAKLAWLSRTDAYPAATAAVERIDTHLSHVFLTDGFVYKLKKPVRRSFVDLSTLQARRVNCIEEVRLNRRLAPDTYLAVVPLVAVDGALRLCEGEGAAEVGDGEVVEWLVKMRRLPRELMLDEAIRSGAVDAGRVDEAARALACFYRDAEPLGVSPRAWRVRQRRQLVEHARDLAAPRYGLEPAVLERVVAAQSAFLDRESALLDARAAGGRIVEGHGDLRPEHVCLSRPPVFIDCLEFDADLRTVDPVDELGYLALECDLLGAPAIGVAFMRVYRAVTGDEPPAPLLRFHRVQRALLRAKLAAWHLDEPLPDAQRTRWTAAARRYLSAAAHAIDET